MKAELKKDKITNIAKRWKELYYNQEKQKWNCDYNNDKSNKYEKLVAIDCNTITEKEIVEIIGNKGWTNNRCWECGDDNNIIVSLGQDSENSLLSFYICENCLQKALKLIEDNE